MCEFDIVWVKVKQIAVLFYAQLLNNDMLMLKQDIIVTGASLGSQVASTSALKKGGHDGHLQAQPV